MKPYYITTPLYYVNDKPHIGHAYTNVLCDTFARFERFRMSEREVFFLTGTDEHGEKIDRAAKKLGVDTKVFIDGIVPRFKDLWTKLDITYSSFIRTTDEKHKRAVQHMISVLEKKGDIYKGPYTGWYCTPCESFWTTKQLIDGKCSDCRREVVEISEENYFFRMSKYQDWLKKYIEGNKHFIRPEHHRNEVLSFLNEPLGDLCITRPKTRLSWGIPYPGSDTHVIYVWFDALTNYISAVGYGEEKEKERFKKLWPADLHMVGKDILRHHAVYWTIMLKALELEEPRAIFAHGWWTMSGDKMSKSRGNIVDPSVVVDTYGVDGLRYYYLHEVTLGSDGAYSEELLTERFNKDLADELGNLVKRSLTMVGKYSAGRYPDVNIAGKPSTLFEVQKGLGGRLSAHMDNFRPREALDEIWAVVRTANRFIDDEKPWTLAKDPARADRLLFVLATLLESIRVIAIALTPFLPHTARAILNQLQFSSKGTIEDVTPWPAMKPGHAMGEATVLFPKIQAEGEGHE